MAFIVTSGGLLAQDKCMEESVYTDSVFNVEVARTIYKKFATSNSPLYKGKYLRHVAASQFEENKKDGKVVSRDMLFTVVRQNEKGKCVVMKMKIRQDAVSEGNWGKPYVEMATPQSGAPDCACVLKMKDWYKP